MHIRICVKGWNLYATTARRRFDTVTRKPTQSRVTHYIALLSTAGVRLLSVAPFPSPSQNPDLPVSNSLSVGPDWPPRDVANHHRWQPNRESAARAASSTYNSHYIISSNAHHYICMIKFVFVVCRKENASGFPPKQYHAATWCIV